MIQRGEKRKGLKTLLRWISTNVQGIVDLSQRRSVIQGEDELLGVRMFGGLEVAYGRPL